MRVLALLALLNACDEQDVHLDDTHGADDTSAPGYMVDVVADDVTVAVDLSTLAATTFEGNPAVELPDVLTASGLGVTWSERTYDFEGSDGYRPSGNDCPPVDWTAAQLGYLFPDSGNLVWDGAAGLRGCYYVDAMVIVDVQDAAR